MEMNLSTILTVEEFLANGTYEMSLKTTGDETFYFRLPKGRTLIIPGYQREIRWKKKNVEVLFENIEESNKFLGSILISKKDEMNFEVIDGQQRITVLLLFLYALINTKNVPSIDLCQYSNETIKSFQKMLRCNFDENCLKAEDLYEECIKEDILDQRQALKEIWDTLNECIAGVNPRKRKSLFEKVLTCTLNVIMSCESGGMTSNSICVDYYLDLNAKAVKLDSVDILKAELFRKNYALMTSKWENVQKAIKRWNLTETKYSNNTFFFHYFACIVNKYLNNQLTILTPELKLLKRIGDGDEAIPEGTHIIDAISDASFCDNAMEEIEKCVKCYEDISISKGNIYPQFFVYFGGKNSVIANAAFHIINTILKMDNEVPKILVTKYFLEVMNNNAATKDDYALIYYIYVVAILFVTTPGKKSSPQLVRLVLSDNWKTEIKKLAFQKYKSELKTIQYDKPTKSNNEITKTSGQYLPKHIFAIRQFILLTLNGDELYIPNEGRLKEFLEDKKISAEHFFVNQSEIYEFSYGEGKTTSIKCPAKVKKVISFPINYLYLDKDENSAVGDGTIIEKITKLDMKERAVFSSELVYQYFLKAKEIFCNGMYPRNLNEVTSERTAKKLVGDYYKNHFWNELKKYIEAIKCIELVYSKEEDPPIWKVKDDDVL